MPALLAQPSQQSDGNETGGASDAGMFPMSTRWFGVTAFDFVEDSAHVTDFLMGMNKSGDATHKAPLDYRVRDRDQKIQPAKYMPAPTKALAPNSRSTDHLKRSTAMTDASVSSADSQSTFALQP
jgi:hypothetical protein